MKLRGGNYALFNLLIGTLLLQVNFANKVLFIEEIDEPAYKIENASCITFIMQVFLKNLQGIIIGNLDIQQNNYFFIILTSKIFS